jgi:hypothetical protein
VQGFASGFLPTPPHDDAVASGSELAPPLPPGDFHPQSIAHAGRTQGRAQGRVADAMAQAPPLTLIFPRQDLGTYREDGLNSTRPAPAGPSGPTDNESQTRRPGPDRRAADLLAWAPIMRTEARLSVANI